MMPVFLGVGLLLGLVLHSILGISPAGMMAVALLTPILLYIFMMGMLTIGLLARSRLQRPWSGFRTRPHQPPDDADGGLTGVREPRRPLAPSGMRHAAVQMPDDIPTRR